MLFTVEMKMGRLLEIRVASGFRTVADVDAMFHELASVVADKSPRSWSGAGQRGGERHITIADWRQCVIMSTEAAERLQQRMTDTNPNVIRAAAIASYESPSAVMQFLRVVRDSQHEERRLFFEEGQTANWLGEVLTPTEAARLRIFLREGRPSGVTSDIPRSRSFPPSSR